MPLHHYTPPTEPYLEILYRDDDLLLLNKPSGLLSVPGKAPEHYDSLVSRVLLALPTARVVHRLDMATSGLLLMALNKPAQAHLQRQFERREIHKVYLAQVWGQPPASAGVIDLAMRCDWPQRPLQMLDERLGKPAQTHYRVIGQQRHGAVLELRPWTGRSHQLRLHCQAIGCAILGDKFYATREALAAASRLCLHAQQLQFRHPADGRELNFVSPAAF